MYQVTSGDDFIRPHPGAAPEEAFDELVRFPNDSCWHMDWHRDMVVLTDPDATAAFLHCLGTDTLQSGQTSLERPAVDLQWHRLLLHISPRKLSTHSNSSIRVLRSQI